MMKNFPVTRNTSMQVGHPSAYVSQLLQTPPTQITLKHLSDFKKNNNAIAINKSGAFLQTEIPKRLAVVFSQLEQTRVRHERFFSVNSVERMAGNLSNFIEKLPQIQTVNNVQSLAQLLQQINNTSQNDINDVVSTLHQQYEKYIVQNSNLDSNQLEKYAIISSLNSLLDSLYFHLIPLRVIISQFLYTYKKYQNPQSDEQLNDESVVNDSCNVHSVIEVALEDARAFCIEKTGDAPLVQLINRCPQKLLKNSLKAVLDFHSSSSSIPPTVNIELSENSEFVGIKVSDQGGGISPKHLNKLFDYFFSTTPPAIPTYMYGGQFGAAFTGYGIGLPVSRQYARFMGYVFNLAFID